MWKGEKLGSGGGGVEDRWSDAWRCWDLTLGCDE